MTRTKNRVFILTDAKRPSEFFREFQPSKSVYILSKDNRPEDQVLCPRCKTGHLIVQKNESTNQFFVGCSNYPQCDYTVRDTSVISTQKMCPACGGFLVKRRGKFGQFYGCTNFPACKYTEKME